MKHFLTTAFLFVCLTCMGANLYADDHSPTEQLQPVLNDLIEVLDDETLKGDALREERRGKIMAIIASGFAETDRVREALNMGVGQFIKKPYAIEDIGVAVKKELMK